jgi:hypothetical protein
MEALNSTKKNYSAHSIKAGAIGILMKAAADGTITLGDVMQMSKHIPPAGLPLAPTTVGYVRNKLLVARAMKTHILTQLL